MDLPPDEAQPQGFNSQPPEGGWKCRPKLHPTTRVSTHSRPKAAGLILRVIHWVYMSFNSQPPEGGWNQNLTQIQTISLFQLTAARRRLGTKSVAVKSSPIVSTHSRPKAAGASAETLNRQGLHCPVSLRFH